MRALVQRTKFCEISIDNQITAQTAYGMLILLGVEPDDTSLEIDYLIKKISNLRIFNDENEVMNKSIIDAKGEIMVVSQFTLMANTAKGNRPSYIHAARPEVAIPLYEEFIAKMKTTNLKVETGVFGADMKINLLNDGPVTIWFDTKNK